MTKQALINLLEKLEIEDITYFEVRYKDTENNDIRVEYDD